MVISFLRKQFLLCHTSIHRISFSPHIFPWLIGTWQGDMVSITPSHYKFLLSHSFFVCLCVNITERELRIKDTPDDTESHEAIARLLGNYLSQLSDDMRQPDFTNYRLQLWKAMKKFPEKCALKTDELCKLYCNFLKYVHFYC